VQIDALTLSGLGAEASDLLNGAPRDLREGLTLAAHGFVWLRVTPLP
jgi:amylosucrase